MWLLALELDNLTMVIDLLYPDVESAAPKKFLLLLLSNETATLFVK